MLSPKLYFFFCFSVFKTGFYSEPAYSVEPPSTRQFRWRAVDDPFSDVYWIVFNTYIGLT